MQNPGDAADIQVVIDFLSLLQVKSEVITIKMYPHSKKRPDLRCEYGKGGRCFAEVKSPKLKEAPVGGFAHSTTMSKLAGMVGQATAQLKSVNPRHFVPNMLI